MDYVLNRFNINKKIEKVHLSNDIKEDPSINYYDEDSYNEIIGFPEHANINKLKLPAYLYGFWQSEKYFNHNKKIILEELQFNTPLDGKNKEVARDIMDHNSVAMHIRRGDYHFHSHFGMCNADYYHKAVSYIEKQVENPKFFIFANDHHWVKNNIHIQHPTYEVKHNSVEKGFEDLQLMSLCKNFIIANSSFSWWGAWLSDNETKIITTPKPWFIYRKHNVRYIDQGKHFHPIKNDHSDIFNESKNILFRLNPYEASNDFYKTKNVDIKVDKQGLNIHTTSDKSKLFLKKISKLDMNNDVIIKLSLKSLRDDVIQLYYTTQNSNVHSKDNGFHSYYYEDEEFETYVHLPKEALLTNIMIVPALKEGTDIIIKDLEIREIQDSKNLPKYTSPILLSSDPADGATRVALNKLIKVKFDQGIKPGNTYWIDLRDENMKLITINKSINGKVLTIEHPTLAENTEYTLLLHTGALTGLEGHPIPPGKIIFTTGSRKKFSLPFSSLLKRK